MEAFAAYMPAQAPLRNLHWPLSYVLESTDHFIWTSDFPFVSLIITIAIEKEEVAEALYCLYGHIDLAKFLLILDHPLLGCQVV